MWRVYWRQLLLNYLKSELVLSQFPVLGTHRYAPQPIDILLLFESLLQ